MSCLATVGGGSAAPLLVGGTVAGTVVVWDTLSGALIASWEAHIKKVTAVALSPDGALLATASEDATVAVWSLPAVAAAMQDAVSARRPPAPLRMWSLHSLSVTGVAFCGGGGGSGVGGCSGGRARVVSTSLDHTARVWDVATGACLATYTLPSFLTCVACDPCGRFAVVGSGDSIIYRINLLPFDSNSSSSSSFVSFASSSSDGSVASSSAASASSYSLQPPEQCKYEGHSRPITSVAVNGNGARVVSASLDGSVVVWDTLSRQPVLRFAGHNGAVNCVVIAPLPGTIAEPNAAVLPVVPLKKASTQNPLAQTQLSVSQAFASNPANAKKRSREEATAAAAAASDAKTLGGLPAYVLPEVQFGVDEIWRDADDGDDDADTALDAMVDEAVRTGAEEERAKADGAKVDSAKTLERMLSEARASEARWKAAANNLYQLNLKQAISADTDPK